MFNKDWEKRWEKYTFDFAAKVNQSKTNKDEKDEWLSDFLQSSVILTHFLLPSIVEFVKEFKLKIHFNEKSFEKKLTKFKREEVEHVIKLFLMDYFSCFLDNPIHLDLLTHENVEISEIDTKVGQFLLFNKKEKDIYHEMVFKKDTYYSTVLLLQTLHLGKDAKNEGLVEGIEVIKESVYNKMDQTFQKLIQTKK